MALSDSSREVLEAVRKRLATAKSQASAASTNLASIKQMLVNAQSMSDAADKEVNEAQTALDEAEKKYEVINIDDDDVSPAMDESSSNKRRKVSLSPQANNNSIRNSTTATSIAVGSSSSSNTTNNLNNSAASKNGLGFDQIMVSGCGHSVYGKYKQENGSLYAGAPLFTKQVGQTTFAIYRVPSTQKYWYIGRWNRILNSELPSSRLFKSNLYTRECILIPPETGWVSCIATLSALKVPTCRFLTNGAASAAAATVVNELVVSGCGVPMANGTYKRAIRVFNGLPMYIKTGQMLFIIVSAFDDKHQRWKISQLGDARSMYKSVTKCRVGGKLDGAPLDNSAWCLTKEGKGVHPPPQVKWG